MSTTQKKLTAKQVDNVLSDYLAHLKAEGEHSEKLKARKGK